MRPSQPDNPYSLVAFAKLYEDCLSEVARLTQEMERCQDTLLLKRVAAKYWLMQIEKEHRLQRQGNPCVQAQKS